MSENEQFQVTLVSNTKGVDGTTNTPDNFAVKIPVKRRLDGEWEVALMEIQYPGGGKTIEEDIDLGFVVIAPPEIILERKNEEDAFDTEVYDVLIFYFGYEEKYTTEELNQLTAAQKAHLKFRQTIGGWATLSKSVGYVHVHIPKGPCPSIEKFVQILNQKVEEAYNFILKNTAASEKAGDKLKFQYDPVADRVTSTKANWKVEFFCKGLYIHHILGFSDLMGKDLHRIKFELTAPRAPILELLPSIFIYSKIIEYQIVGDTLTPLLGILPVKSGALEQTHWTFTPPYYIPVKTTELDIIGIQLKSDTGDPYPLAASAKVVVRLHFRRRRQLL